VMSPCKECVKSKPLRVQNDIAIVFWVPQHLS
jgi:hypothetical protein